MAINAQELQGKWNSVKGQVKEKWGQLTDDDLTVSGGNFDQLVGKIQQKTGVARDAIEKFLGELTQHTGAAVASATQAAADFAHTAGDRISEGYSKVSAGAKEKYEQAEELVRSNPAQSVAAAFGIGLVAGLVVGIAIRSR